MNTRLKCDVTKMPLVNCQIVLFFIQFVFAAADYHMVDTFMMILSRNRNSIHLRATTFRTNDPRDCPESKLVVWTQRISIKIQESGSYKSVGDTIG